MNGRFAEICRTKHLDFESFELPVCFSNINDGRSDNKVFLTRQQDIFIGVFFDGTDNNKYRDTTGMSQSNVARLYEVYPGKPAARKPPKFKPAFSETYLLDSFNGKLFSKMPSNEDGRFDPIFHTQRAENNSRSQFS